MITNKPHDKLIFIDIETTSQYISYDSMPVDAKALFYKRFEKDIDTLADTEITITEGTAKSTSRLGFQKAVEEIYNTKAPLYAEWNKVICISIGSLDISDPKGYKLRVVSISGDDEVKLLNTFLYASKKISKPTKLSEVMADEGSFIVAHNGLVFDIPVLAKRMIYNKIKPPFMLSLGGLKPWDVKWIVDTKEYWKMGVFDGNVSLDQLCHSFGVPSSKQLMQGKDVKDVYYVEKDLKKIEKYCEADVLATCKVFLNMSMDYTPVEYISLDLEKVLAGLKKQEEKAAAKA